MNLRVIREPSKSGATLGVLFVKDEFFGHTLEDEIREKAGPVSTWKVKGQTAIPAGRYHVALRPSPRFGRVLPWLQDVRGFEWILIHAGNRSHETEGCLLVGLDRAPAEVRRSQMALQRLMLLLAEATDEITITIENPPGYVVSE